MAQLSSLTNNVPKPVYIYHTCSGADLLGLISTAHSSPVYVPPRDLCQPSQMMPESPGCRPNFLVSCKGLQISRPESAQTTFFTYFNQFLTLLCFLVVEASLWLNQQISIFGNTFLQGQEGKIGNLPDCNLF